jgi:hypothetical protein
LNAWERAQFIEVSNGKRELISAQFLSQAGCGSEMLGELTAMGASIDYSDLKSGYALVTIPRGKLLETLDLGGIQFAYTRDDERMYYQDPVAKIPQDERKPEPVPQISIPYPHVAKTLPEGGPYFATHEIGLDELWKEHPEADGRGTRVAVPDEGFDLLHPALLQARDSEGNTVPKVADLGALTSSEEDSGWVDLGKPIVIQDGTFQAAGRTWKAPAGERFRFGIFTKELVLGPQGNSHSQKVQLSVGVLVDEEKRLAWVDTDGDGSFVNQRSLGDYGQSQDVDWFGTQRGDEDNRIPFGVKFYSARHAIYIRVGGDHGALVAGPLAGNRLTGGLFNGAAPGAQLIDESLGRSTLIAAMVQMAARPDVDVINRSGGIARAGFTGNREGIEDFAQHVLERLSLTYEKPIVCFCDATGAVFVDDYASAEMLRRNRQLAPPYRDTINGGLSGRSDGLVNTVLAPSANLETESRYEPLDVLWDDGKRHTYSDGSLNPPAPDGYVIGANNSPTIPVVSGIFADLISEARRKHIRYDADRLNNAIFTGTTLLDGIPISQQGYGLINAAHSWDQLEKMAKADDAGSPQLTSFVISRRDGSEEQVVQGYKADVSKPGEQLAGELWITRRGGPAGGRQYLFSLRGDTANFELIDQGATLIRDKAVRVRFRTKGQPGWNICFLELKDASAGAVMDDVPLSVRAPDVAKLVGPGIEKYEADIPPLRSQLEYVEVGKEVQAARYEVKIPYTSSLVSFPGGRSETHTTPPGEPVDAAHHIGPMQTFESLVANNEPGTQTVFWENRGRPEYATEYDGPAPDVPIHAQLTLTKYAVSITKGDSDSLRVENRLAEIEGRVELYDAAVDSLPLVATGLHPSGESEITLPSDLDQWRVRVTTASETKDPSDIYLLDCTGKSGCYVAAQKEATSPAQTLVIDKPAAGNWKVLVRSRKGDSSPRSYTIVEASLSRLQSASEPTDRMHGSGEVWMLPLPKKQSDAQYAAFRIAGTPGNPRQKNGVLVAMTPLDGNAP